MLMYLANSSDQNFTESEKCPYCGTNMLRRSLQLKTSTGHTTIYGPTYCNCADAVAEREAARKHADEQERKERQRRKDLAYRRKCLSSGIPERFIDIEPNAIYAEELQRNGFYIHGDIRSGKTTLAISIAKSCIAKRQSVVFTTFSQISLHLRQAFSDNCAETEKDLLHKYLTCDCLVIDDLGHESLSDYTIERLMIIIGERFNDLRPVIITSQYSPAELGRKLARKNPQTALAVTRRLKDYCRCIDLGN